MVGLRGNRHCPPLPASRDACGLLALMIAECATLESNLMFAGFLLYSGRGAS